MTTWSMRIKLRMKELGMTQEVLASKMGITRGAVTHYLAARRVPPLRQFQKLAAVLKADPAWLQFGTTEENNKSTKKQVIKNEKVEPAQSRIPVLSWELVSEFIGATKIKQDAITEYLSHYYTDKPRWYALRIMNDAMISTHGASKGFYEGDIIVIDPDKLPINKSFVIALLPKSKEATFKQYVVDGGIRYLKPLNPQYPITKIEDSTHICGVVVGSVSQF